MSTETTLKGLNSIGDYTLNDILPMNLVEFFNWGCLGAGGFFNINMPTSGAYGGDYSRLRLVNDPNYTVGQVWESARQNWVWQSGIQHDVQPIQFSGVYIDGTFHAKNATGVYSYTTNYPLGRIIFSSPISASAVVRAEYAHTYFNWYTSNTPWFRELQQNSFRVDDPHFLQYGSGAWGVLSQNRVQLPAVVVQPVPRRSFDGLQLGGGQIVRQDVMFWVFAETDAERNKAVDIITSQNNKTIYGFSPQLMADNDRFPLTFAGDIAPSALCYPDLTRQIADGGFRWKKIYFEEMSWEDSSNSPGVHRAAVRGRFAMDYPTL